MGGPRSGTHTSITKRDTSTEDAQTGRSDSQGPQSNICTKLPGDKRTKVGQVKNTKRRLVETSETPNNNCPHSFADSTFDVQIIPQEKTPCVVSYAKERDVKQEELEGQNREGEKREGGVKDSRLPRSAKRVALRK